jgi:dihydrofolate reductase
MSRVRVHSFTISLDGYSAAPGQCFEHPFGPGGAPLIDWLHATEIFHQTVLHTSGGSTGVDDQFARQGFEGLGAWIIGRNMFTPYRGGWEDQSWQGWWGDEPPFATPVYVLTHHPRKPISMKNGTVFHFVTDGIHSALEQARKAAGSRDVRIGGGAATIRQYLEAKLIDELRIASIPVFLGAGESAFHGVDLATLGYATTERLPGENATFVTIRRKG